MRKLILTTLCLGCLLCGFVSVLGANTPVKDPEPGRGADLEKKRQDSLRAVRLEKVAAFRAVYPQAKVQTNPVTGAPEDIWGDISKNQTQTDPITAAYEFFEQNKAIYGISNPREELKLQRKSIDQYGGMVDFKQLYKGVEVYQSSLRAYYTPSGKLKGIMGGFAQVPADFSAIPVIDSIAAIGITKRALGLPSDYEKRAREYLGSVDSTTSPISISLAITPFHEKYHLVWITDLNVDYGHGLRSWKYFVDAYSGSILKREPLFMEEPEGTTRVLPDSQPSPVLKPNKQNDSPFAPKKVPRQESSSSVESAPIPTESWVSIPPKLRRFF